jgi:hypothetical protein
MRILRIVASFTICILAAASLQAQVPLGRWEKVEGLQPGTSIIIRLKTGDLLEGAFKSFSRDSVVLIDWSALEWMIPKSTVQKIETSAKVPDRLRNGTLIGMLIGMAAGIGGMVAFRDSVTSNHAPWSDEERGFVMIGALVGGGVGAGTGAIVDASFKRRTLLYQAR